MKNKTLKSKMMSKREIYDLLEINDPEYEIISVGVSQNWVKHLFIRLLSVVIIVGGMLLLSEFGNYGSNDSLAILLGCVGIFIIWFLILIIEAIVLQVRKKHVLRNVNLILIFISLFIIAFAFR